MAERLEAGLRRLLPKRADLGAIIALVLVLVALGLVFVEYDILTQIGESPTDALWLEIEEAFALSAILVIGLFVISNRRARQARRELERRLAAEVEARKALELAMLDPLTGLANRRHFDDIFHAAAHNSTDDRHALLLLDLNGFKTVNDAFGHPEGDAVLKIVSARLKRALKGDDFVSRVGGDEFSIVAFDLGDAAAAEALALHLMEVIAAPIEIGDRRHEITVSIGFTMFPERGVVPADIYRRADAALYRAKANKGEGRPVQG
ncbi:diguanylate cyclase domain-containing protein [Acuticoccus kandeliae]|uniref:diguanylate cyclase domain-containing protein n=1 Tax=Acuticoccus kandeliae TaxID=2073160 RepID=UPI000D3E60D5|nr:diguanylate cyclase [Acuticoccus kandeliae]